MTEKASSLARKYEITGEGGDEVKEARTLPTVEEAVKGYLADAEARGLAPATIQKLEHIFKKQLLAFSEQHRIISLRDVNVRNMTEWRSTWADKPLARKKKFERVVGFFWFCVRHGWLKDNPTATMGRVIARHVRQTTSPLTNTSGSSALPIALARTRSGPGLPRSAAFASVL